MPSVIGKPIIYDVTLTSTPTPLWPTPRLFSGWITAASTNSGGVTLESAYGTGHRVAYQADQFANVDLNQILASGNGQKLCIAGTE